MKAINFFLVGIFLIVESTHANTLGSPKEVSHSLKEVTVYRSSAQLFHEAKVSLNKGRHQLLLQGVAQQIDASTLQCTGKGRGMILSVSVEQNFLHQRQGNKDRIQALTDSIDVLKESLGIVQDKLDVLLKEEGLLMANQKLGGDQSATKVDELMKAAQFFRSRLQEIRADQRKLNQQRTIISQRLKRCEDQLNAEQSDSGLPSMDLVIEFQAETDGQFLFSFNYTAYGAQWIPLYDLRVQGGSQEVQLQMKASIAQQTGLDWSQVKLRLSSRNPSRGGQAPEINPWRLDFRPKLNQTMRPQSMRKSKAALPQEYAGAAPIAEVADEAELSEFGLYSKLNTVSENALAIEYTLAGTHSILSGPKSEQLDVAQYSLPASYQYLIVPRLSEEAYLMAKLTDWAPYNLSLGQLSIFLDGSFTGKTIFNPQQATDTLEISLGVDPAVVVKREANQVFSSSKTIGSQKKVNRGFRITVKNGRNSPIDLHLIEQVPLSTNNQITVELIKTENGMYDSERGLLHWRATLVPNASFSREISYEVKFPKDQIIDGL